METGFARINREKTIATLARNLFDLRDADRATRRRVEREILRLNPGLRRPEGFRPGRAVIVPRLPDLKLTDRVEIQKPDVDGLLQETARRLQVGVNLIEEGAATERSRLEAGIERLGDRRIAALVRKENPDAAKLLPQISRGLKERADVKAKSAERLQRAFTDAQSELAKLARRARSSVQDR